MPTVYQFAEPDVMDLLRRVMNEHHPMLHEARVLVGVKMARNPEGPALKHAGYPALATIKVVSAKDRVSKKYEAEMCIDEREWEDLAESRRRALLDHELSHLTLVMLPIDKLRRARADDPEAPAWALDDKGRPKLKLVPGDWNAGDGFKAVCERHGDDAIEFYHLAKCWTVAKLAAEGQLSGSR